MITSRTRRLVAGFAGIVLCAAVPVDAGRTGGVGSSPGPRDAEPNLSAEERRELQECRAVLEGRVNDLIARAGACGDPRARVRQSLAAVQHVRGVEVGSVLLTSDPPRVPVAVGIELRSGRVVWDRLVVTVSVSPRVVLLGSAGSGRATPPAVCRGDSPGVRPAVSPDRR